ncbi:MBL fold metallo-hydrolase [Rhodococcoides kroppenstedtii]|uniref:MBL fold metallo-hydrolase n=1 Tax=Rhodococcoides kroppenstedtii TaxID=293050 RepID=UPI0028E55D22|nr:MBL fold metallo-hydrolase [Rhodococcus kroppenstedtii]
MTTPGDSTRTRLPVCTTCGVQYDDVDPEVCPICTDDRQYVGAGGQRWTTVAEVSAGHRTVVRPEITGLTGIGTEPGFAIGQRALLVPGEGGNVLWDSVSSIDDAAIARVTELGGVAAIALSHPHYYSAMVEWSDAFGGAPIYVHADDRRWIPRRGSVRTWDGDTLEILPGRTLINTRVHFAGGTVLHWPGPDGRGDLCSGDIVQVVADRRWVSFMYSYPNLIPEHPDTVRRTVRLLRDLEFETVHGAWWGKVVESDGRGAVVRSARRYLEHLGLTPDF